jgi:NAD(P)-dependent dehydrogenase (short-subunit alcohol dehydrogenase family)
VSFLASADAAFMTGQTLIVDGGSAMLSQAKTGTDHVL